MSDTGSWYFSAPFDPVLVRRGDALGFRAGADYFANLIAPGLSNATSDARWISILSWCLNWSRVVWSKAGGCELTTAEAQQTRYAWLRPLELLWVDRALEAQQVRPQLRGRRSVERWRDEGRLPLNFAMSADQFRRYRQVGMYGGYRVVFRSIDGFTTGDGWTLADAGLSLAKLVNESLPKSVRLTLQQFESGRQWSQWSGGNESRYWVEHGWPTWLAKVGGILPTPDASASQRLPEQERRILEATLFASDSVRRATAETLSGATAAKSHIDLCEALANSSALARLLQSNVLTVLPAFSDVADAAMHAMRGLWAQLNRDDASQSPPIAKLATSGELKARLERLRAAALRWLVAPGRAEFPHDQTITALAEALRDAETATDQLRALTRHHYEYGGGRRWFREQAGKLTPLVAVTDVVASDYRFRLRALCRLAAQCGVTNMKGALAAEGASTFESGSAHEADEQGDEL